MGTGRKRTLSVAFIAGAVTVIVLAGCGGGAGPGGVNTGTVAGEVRDLTSGLGIGQVAILVSGQIGVSDASGHFEVIGVAPGNGLAVGVTPPSGMALPPGAVVGPVAVIAGQTTTLPTPINLVDVVDLPPSPPG
jgi:hypothetical protein